MSVKIVDFNEKFDAPIAIALGFFDCIHIGHKRLVDEVEKYAASHNGVKSALFTFRNDPNVLFGKEKEIFTFSDRVCVLDNLGVDVVISACFDTNFMSMSPLDFISGLANNKKIELIAVGADYTYGKNAEGNVNTLREFCDQNGIKLCVVPFETVDGEKLSTRNLKKLVSTGDVVALNKILSAPYFIKGVVLHAKHNGTGIGFPTANLAIDNDRLSLCEGIYATMTHVDGEVYQSMTNVGAKPTFNDNSPSIETYIFDFDADLYGKEIQVDFIARTRDIQKFDDKSKLHDRLKLDEAQIRQLLANRRSL